MCPIQREARQKGLRGPFADVLAAHQTPRAPHPTHPPAGYRRVGVAIPQYAHCVDPVMLRDNKTWLLFHNGDGSPTGVCSAGWWACGTPVDQVCRSAATATTHPALPPSPRHANLHSSTPLLCSLWNSDQAAFVARYSASATHAQGNKDGYVAGCTAQGNGSTPDPSLVRGRRAPPPPAEGYEASNGVHVSTNGPHGPWRAANGTAHGYPFDDCPAVHVLSNGASVAATNARQCSLSLCRSPYSLRSVYARIACVPGCQLVCTGSLLLHEPFATPHPLTPSPPAVGRRGHGVA